jgi:hypothetical protein
VPYGFILIEDIFVVFRECAVEGGRSPTGTAHSLKVQFYYLSFYVMINNSSLAKWDRLNSKQLDSQFQNDIIQGLNCSPFEARAILDSVHKVYSDYFNLMPTLNPGQIQFVITGVENGPSKSLKNADMVNVTLTLDAGNEDIEVKKEHGVIGLRLHRLQRICQEALVQGGVLTIEDIANRIFNCGERTLVRDIKALKQHGIVLPLRSTIKDMGRTLSHRVLIVEKWLQGMEYLHIAKSTNHSPSAVSNYVRRFKQVVTLAIENYDVHSIAFMAHISRPLAEEYIKLWHHAQIIQPRRDELLGTLKK